MKVEWEADKSYWNTVYKSGILKVKFRPETSHEIYYARLFDPAAIGFCFQETATATTSCGGLDTGDYGSFGFSSPENANDTLYTTSSFRLGFPASYYVNYTIPDDVYGAKLSHKLSTDTGTFDISCNNGTSWHSLATIDQDEQILNTTISNDCMATGKVQIKISASGGINQKIWEEGIWWLFPYINVYKPYDKIELTTSAVLNMSGNGTICLDINHPDFGKNVTCFGNSSYYTFNLSYFNRSFFSDSSRVESLIYSSPGNITVNISAHQYDEPLYLSMNLTGYDSGSGYPTGVKLFLNNTLVKNIGNITSGSGGKINLFSDDNISKTAYFKDDETLIVGYIKIKEGANITAGIMNVTSKEFGYNANTDDYAIGIAATTLNSYYTQTYGCTQTKVRDGVYKLNCSQDDYEKNRARVLKSIYMDKSLNGDGNNIYRASSGLTDIIVPTIDDTNKRMVNTYMNRVDHNGWAYGTFTSTSNNINVSTWIHLYSWSYCNQYYKLYIPGSTLQYSKDVSYSPINEDWYGNDTTSWEVDNPINITLQGGTSSGGCEAYIYSMIFTRYPIVWSYSTTGGCGTCSLHAWTHDSYINYSIPLTKLGLPTDISVDVGALDGEYEYTNAGNVSYIKEESGDISSAIRNYLNSCTYDDEGYCYVPIYAHSDTAGEVEIQFSLDYVGDQNIVTVSTTDIEQYLNKTIGFTSLPIKVENNVDSIINISGIIYYYRGGNSTISYVAHNPEYTINTTGNITFFYSGWNYSFPKNIYGFNFYPATPTSQNVTPFGQTNTVPIISVTNRAYGGKFNFTVIDNSTKTCVNLSIKSGDITLYPNATWKSLNESSTTNENINIWMYANLGCSYTTWRTWFPNLYMRACCIGCACSEDLI